MLTPRGTLRHQRMMRLNVATALCDASLRLDYDRVAGEGDKACPRCVETIRNGYFDAELGNARKGIYA
jgi:hypothetical protein